ncbi:MAG TPA: PIN domain-containing protein [Candidatus Limnocylindrales bacterium]|nr:PIN domain-containing protein [Candidatus Limnocylindrales bacterium]
MDRLFLDANVLFSAAYLPSSGLLRLWRLDDVALCSSAFAVGEARINLDDEAQRARLAKLAESLELFDAAPAPLPAGVHLPEKDAPILLAAIEARATHLITGDLRHFGAYFGKRVAGVLVETPGDYLRQRR